MEDRLEKECGEFTTFQHKIGSLAVVAVQYRVFVSSNNISSPHSHGRKEERTKQWYANGNLEGRCTSVNPDSSSTCKSGANR